MRAVVILALLAAASPAHADNKSESVSVGLAAAGTGVSGALVLSAFLVDADDGNVNMPLLYTGIGTSVITPSLGHLYAHDWLTIGMGIRAAAGALALYGVSRKQDERCDARPAEICPTITSGGMTLISIAAIAYIGGAAWDVRDARDAVRRYNQRGTGMMFTPVAMRGGGGLAVSGSF